MVTTLNSVNEKAFGSEQDNYDAKSLYFHIGLVLKNNTQALVQ